MSLRAWAGRQRPQAIVLWILALLLVGFALVDVPLLGMESATLAILAAVSAALTSVYSRNPHEDA